MPAFRAAVVPFVVNPDGSGLQTVGNIRDRTGTLFQGRLVIWQYGFATIDTVTSGGFFINKYMNGRGLDTGSIRVANCACSTYSGFNFKAASGAVSFGNHSLIDVGIDNFGQISQWYRLAKIEAFRVGEMDVRFTQNDRSGDTVVAIVLGGDACDFFFANWVNGTYTAPSKPQGLLAIPTNAPAASGSDTWGTGGEHIAWGFATRRGDYGASNLNVVNQGNNWSLLRNDTFNTLVDQTTGVQTAHPTVSAWTDTAFTIAGNSDSPSTVLAFCGTDVRTAGGHALEPAADGTAIIDVGIKAELVFLWCIGQDAGTATRSGAGQLAQGWYNGATLAAFWSGEATVGNVGPGMGARYITQASALRAGTPNAASTTFHSRLTPTSLTVDGKMHVAWTGTDGTARHWAWFAIGTDAEPIPPDGGGGGEGEDCVTAPPAVACWDGGSADSLSCWDPYESTTLQVRLNEEGQP